MPSEDGLGSNQGRSCVPRLLSSRRGGLGRLTAGRSESWARGWAPPALPVGLQLLTPSPSYSEHMGGGGRHASRCGTPCPHKQTSPFYASGPNST